MVKRSFDLILALIGAVPLLILFPVLFLLTRVIVGKPALISSTCVGRKGRLFYRHRFDDHRRSGSHPAGSRPNQQKQANHKAERSSFIALFAGWPQLLNVIKGDMSLVGPAPESPDVVKNYSEEESTVFDVRPGIIGTYYFREDIQEINRNGNGSLSRRAYVKKILPNKLQRELAYVLDHRTHKDLAIISKTIGSRINNRLRASLDGRIRNYNFLAAIDLFLVFASYFFAYHLRFDWHVTLDQYQTFLTSLPIVLSMRMFVFSHYDMYKSVWKYVGLHELLNIIRASTISSLLVLAIMFLLGVSGQPQSIFIIDWVFCIALIGASRLALRLWYEHMTDVNHFKKNILIMGAGDVGEMLVREMSKSPGNGCDIVGIIDDDESLQGKTVHKVPVLGGKERIPEFVKMLRVDEVVIAMANIDSSEMKSVIRHCKTANVRHRIVPAVNDLLNGKPRLMKSRRVEVADLFGREPLDLDLSGIKRVIQGKSVLVTGAGGSIGSELCRQIAENGPHLLILTDRNENYLQDIRTELQASHEDISLHCHLSDITEEPKQRTIFAKHTPDVVFHAAAQKHVPIAEENPDEAVRTNIYGSKIVANLAAEFAATHFVLISTDKAVNPCSFMGATKRVAELYIQALVSSGSKTKYITVRFGNVFNSNGSVVPTFMKQISRGGPITITHPDIERFFMSIDEAVQLILQSLTLNKSGRIFHLDMGKSIKIDTLAKELIFYMGYVPQKDIQVKYTGLRPGEKLYEELINGHESLVDTNHPRIKALKSKTLHSVTCLDKRISHLMVLAQRFRSSELREKIAEIVPEYTSAFQEKKAQNPIDRRQSVRQPG
ncbi:MAG: SDR family NAD(P)-dependent oxidoreductase [bacterium]